jgi:hypothetical protein
LVAKNINFFVVEVMDLKIRAIDLEWATMIIDDEKRDKIQRQTDVMVILMTKETLKFRVLGFLGQIEREGWETLILMKEGYGLTNVVVFETIGKSNDL